MVLRYLNKAISRICEKLIAASDSETKRTEYADILIDLSIATVRNMFNRADFPSCTFGKEKLVETSALKEYFRLPRRA